MEARLAYWGKIFTKQDKNAVATEQDKNAALDYVLWTHLNHNQFSGNKWVDLRVFFVAMKGFGYDKYGEKITVHNKQTYRDVITKNEKSLLRSLRRQPEEEPEEEFDNVLPVIKHNRNQKQTLYSIGMLHKGYNDAARNDTDDAALKTLLFGLDLTEEQWILLTKGEVRSDDYPIDLGISYDYYYHQNGSKGHSTTGCRHILCKKQKRHNKKWWKWYYAVKPHGDGGNTQKANGSATANSSSENDSSSTNVNML